MTNILTEILTFSVLSGGVSCSKKNVVEDLEEYLENVDYLKSSTTSSLKRCRWFQIIDMLNNRQISPKRNCSTLAIPWCFYKILRAFDGFSTSITLQKYHPPELKHRPIFPLAITAKSAHRVACTSLRRVGHPARALDWVPRTLFVFSLLSSVTIPSPVPSFWSATRRVL